MVSFIRLFMTERLIFLVLDNRKFNFIDNEEIASYDNYVNYEPNLVEQTQDID